MMKVITKMKRILNNLDRNRGFYVLTLLVGVIFSGISVLTPTISGAMITAYSNDAAAGRRMLVLYLIVGLFQIALSLLDAYMGKQLSLRQKQIMRYRVFKTFSQKDSIGREKIASFNSFVNNDIPSLVEQFFGGTIDIIKCIFILIFSAISMLSAHWALALIVFSVSGLILLCPKAMRTKSGKARSDYSDVLGKYNTYLQSFLGGSRIIKSYNYYHRANEIQENANVQIAEKERTLIRCQMNVQSMTSFLQVGKTLLIMIVGVILISLGQMKIGGLVIVVQLAQMIAAPAEVLAYLIHARNEVLPLLERYETMSTEMSDVSEEIILRDKIESISVANVTYEVDGIRILDGITASFIAGNNYLITGESGSGKSTFMRLLARIGDISYSGSITCNGNALEKISSTSYYQRVCPVFQEPYLFHATLEENILLGRPISKDVYIATLKKLNLEYLIDRYQGQELTPEIMEQLSGGERQRVALARAMVCKPEVYLLDEVTSSLDSSNSEAIEELLLHEEAMVVHICHKCNPKLLSLYDRKYLMSGGRLLVNK